MKARILLLIWAVLVAVMPAFAQESVLGNNLTDDCVTEFDPETDYFPEKVDVNDAANFSVEYFNNYKLVTVTGSTETYTYALVQCGTPAPEGDALPEDAQIVEVPAGGIVTLSTTYLPGLAALGLVDNLVGMDSFLYTSTPEVLERIEAGDVIEVAPAFELNTELVLATEPGLVMTDDYDPGRITQLVDLGIVAAVNTDYLEQTPLGRAEWLKYIALFYNAEATAEEIFSEIASAYEEVTDLAASVPEEERPVVLWNSYSTFAEAWSIPGSETYSGYLIEDAGGIIALGAEAGSGSALLSFESVYDGALDADIWVPGLFAINSLEDILALDARYEDFIAVQNSEVWNYDLDVNANGGNNFFELGVLAPHLVLQDLVAIFHPDLLPDHEFTFFRRVEPAE
ncbi:MAG: ABC transporter substrate-binding protein [Anaerolineae bacterium]|nr:ABC transporter substrate-binding protein [Anaerolineae bacterium]